MKPKRSQRRLRSAPRCRLVASWGWNRILFPLEVIRDEKLTHNGEVLFTRRTPWEDFAQNKRHIHVLEELKSIVGSGYLTTTHSDSEYVLKDQRAIEQLLFELYTYVKVKKQVVGLALELIERLKILKTESDFVQAAQLADKISECNLQSKSRRKHTAQSITFPRND